MDITQTVGFNEGLHIETQEKVAAGRALCNEFLKANGIIHPKYEVSLDEQLHMQAAIEYKAGYVKVRALPFVRDWSVTGGVYDLSVPGLIGHAVGLHVNKQVGITRNYLHYLGYINAAEPRISPLESHPPEMVAEMVRLLIFNPELLEVGRPLRYTFLTEHLGLRPVVDKPWQEAFDKDTYQINRAWTWIMR